jgi:hypothetical protein
VAGDAETRRESLLADVGFGVTLRVHRHVQVELREPVRVAGKTILPLTWRASRHESLFPALEADLEVAPLGGGNSQLAMTGRYTPPLGPVGRAVDKALLHRVAEATVRDFVERAANRLRAAVPELIAPSA